MTKRRRNLRVTPKSKHSPIPPKGESKILLKKYSSDWGAYIPVTIHHENDGRVLLHCALGDHHVEAVGRAKEILLRHGYKAKISDSSIVNGEFHKLIYIVTKR